MINDWWSNEYTNPNPDQGSPTGDIFEECMDACDRSVTRCVQVRRYFVNGLYCIELRALPFLHINT